MKITDKNTLFNKFYYWVQTNGFLADIVFRSAFHAFKVAIRLHYWRAAFSKVNPEQLKNLPISDYSILLAGATTVCNAKCIFCVYPKIVHDKTIPTGTMTMDIFKKPVDEWVALGGKNLCLTPPVGEPLLDPNIFEKIDYAVHQAKVPDVNIFTNGILLNRDEKYKKLIDSGIHAIHISTQGTDRALYKEVYGVDKYDNIIAGIQNLLEYNKSKGEPVAIYIRFRNAQRPSQIIRSEDYQKYIKPYISPKVRVDFLVHFDNWGGAIDKSNMRGWMRLKKHPAPVNLPCRILFNYSVLPDGLVRLCGCRLMRAVHDDLVVGDIKTQSLKEIIDGEKTWNVITRFYSGNRPETCKGCTMYNPVDQKWLRGCLSVKQFKTSAKPNETP